MLGDCASPACLAVGDCASPELSFRGDPASPTIFAPRGCQLRYSFVAGLKGGDLPELMNVSRYLRARRCSHEPGIGSAMRPCSTRRATADAIRALLGRLLFWPFRRSPISS